MFSLIILSLFNMIIIAVYYNSCFLSDYFLSYHFSLFKYCLCCQ